MQDPQRTSGEQNLNSDDISASVERTLREQGRRNGLNVAYVRVLALALATVIDTVYWADPRGTIGATYVSPANALLAGAWTLYAAGVVVALRRGWYREFAADAFAMIDCVMVLSLFAVIVQSLDGTEARLHPLVVVAAVCALFAMTGALSLRRRSSWVSTISAVTIFAIAASLVSYTAAQTAFVCAMIASAGLLGARIAAVVRRAVEAEAQKIILGRFLPRELVEADPRAGLRLISEPRIIEATVLVSDLRGFTALAESLTPAQTLEILNAVQGAFAEAVRENGGTVDKFMGDGMLAVFGVPQPLSNHAGASLAAARAMLKKLEQWNVARGSALAAGIGIHSGELLFGCLGSGARLEMTVLGDTVNTASRLQGLTKERGETVLVSEATQRLAGVVLAPLGTLVLRGREQPIAVYAMRDTAV